MFNPFDLNDSSIYLNQFDPDSQYFREVTCNYGESNYYLEKTFKDTFIGNTLDRSLSLLHFNIRSSFKHLEELELYLETFLLT